jgi:hypothetical protein
MIERARRVEVPPRARTAATVVLLAAGFAALVLAAVNAYIRVNVYETDPFADNAVQALRDDAVRDFVGTKLAAQLVADLPPSLGEFAPAIGAAVSAVVDTSRFEQVFRDAAIDANRIFFGKDQSSVALDLSDAGTLIEGVVRSFDPGLADRLHSQYTSLILDVSQRSWARSIVQAAENARSVTYLWPPLAVGLFGLGILVARNRRRAAIAAGLLTGLAAFGIWLGVEIARGIIVSGRSADARDATSGVLDAYLGDIATWCLVLGVAGAALAASAFAAGRPSEVADHLRRVWQIAARRPQSEWLRVLRGLLVGAVGVAAVLERDFALQVVAVIAGFCLVLYGFTEVLRAAEVAVGPRGATLVPWIVAVVASVGIVVGGIVVMT